MMNRPDDQLLLQLQEPSGTWTDIGYMHIKSGKTWFSFTEDYWDNPDRPILGQVFEDGGRFYEPKAYISLPTWFSHLLPEGLMRDAVASTGGLNPRKEFELLEILGPDDLPGALRAIRPESAKDSFEPREENRPRITQVDPILKFSLAGAQLKFSVARSTRSLTVPAKGRAGDVILKLPDQRPGFSGVPEAEFACMSLARNCGIDSAPVELVDPKKVAGLEEWTRNCHGKALAISRFDRLEKDRRCHFEEVAQILDLPTSQNGAIHHHVKYGGSFDHIVKLLHTLCGESAAAEAIRRVTFNALVGNGDAHLKNWSVVYLDGANPSISPAYDILPTVLYIEGDTFGLRLGRSREFSDVSLNRLVALGTNVGIASESATEIVLETVELTHENWTALKDALTSEMYSKITKHRDSIPLSSAR